MEWKYKRIFLLILLFLVYGVSVAQSNISIKYDANGNREQMLIHEAVIKKEIINKKIIRTEISENEFDDGIVVYPNPNKGVLNIRIDTADDALLSQYEIYNVEGILIDKNCFFDMVTINMEGLPSGAYLLKIISADKDYSRIVVKL